MSEGRKIHNQAKLSGSKRWVRRGAVSLLSLAPLLLAGVPAQGIDERLGLSNGTFGDLKRKCGSGDLVDQGYCAGVVVGTLGTMMLLRRGVICPPDRQLTVGDVVSAALKVLDDVPSFSEMQETEGVSYGLALAYPCPAK